ncbi:unnamed protein product [Linum tenue]|uniref:Uncharacterized protein n=1 Tax=Linum tenue TaxID=586396 RepID=A0AAV0IAQ0_9ROSI|nr:unnamed protein product [Linum tenue]
MIPDLVSKLLHHYPVGAEEEAITVFVPSDDTEYEWCETERPEVRVLTGRVDRESFGPGRLSYGSVLRPRDGGGSPIRVTESADHRGVVVDWGLYDDGRRLVVHGLRGRTVPRHRWVRTGPGWLVVSGLIVEKRGPRDPRCPDPDPDMMPKNKEEEEAYRSEYVRRVDGGPLPALLHNGPFLRFHCDRKHCY